MFPPTTEGTCGEHLAWSLTGGLLTISGTGEMTSAPWPADEVEEVVMEEGLTRIMPYAFENCYRLTRAAIPATVEAIPDHAFGQTSLISVVIPDSVRTIGQGAFGYCFSLREVTLGQGLREISGYAFQFTALTSVDIPDGVVFIGNSAFADSALTSVTIPPSVTTLEERAFYCSPSLREARVPEGLWFSETCFPDETVIVRY